jgi:hypothetical protein
VLSDWFRKTSRQLASQNKQRKTSAGQPVVFNQSCGEAISRRGHGAPAFSRSNIMEILFFIIAFSGLFLYERTRTIQSAQWITAMPTIDKDWEQYETPAYQRHAVRIIAHLEPTPAEGKARAKRGGKNKVMCKRLP